jgi:hypothetical protein
MNNEPVAWIDPRELNMDVSTTVTKNKQFDGDIPLYTHPAKTLTDDEIWEVINRTAWVGTEEEIRFKIAEAILRKAQEK